LNRVRIKRTTGSKRFDNGSSGFFINGSGMKIKIDDFEIAYDKKGNKILKYKNSKKLPSLTREQINEIILEALELKESLNRWKENYKKLSEHLSNVLIEDKRAIQELQNKYEAILDYIHDRVKNFPNLKLTISRDGLERKTFFDSVIKNNKENNLRKQLVFSIIVEFMLLHDYLVNNENFFDKYFTKEEINSLVKEFQKNNINLSKYKSNNSIIKFVRTLEGFERLYKDLNKYRKKGI